MKKDVIYIDTEDDITAIIGKVKASAEKIVALVPPKRTGVLQSAVNLKLLQKSAQSDNKHIVLITNDHSLVALAAGVRLPVAKNLQSKPEIPVAQEALGDEEEVINGEELPVGELAAVAGMDRTSIKPDVPRSAADEISDQIEIGEAAKNAASSKKPTPKTPDGKKINIPNFNKFRKKLLIFGGAGLALILFLIWATVIAPSATITIDAKTTAVSVDRVLNINPAIAQTNVGELQFKPNIKQIKKTSTVDFDATGTKDTGDKATGRVTLSNSTTSDAITVPAGTVFTSASGMRFTSNSAATVPGARVSGGGIQPGVTTVAVTAGDIGPEYNIPAQSYTVAMSGVSASGEATTGGTRQKVTIVSQADIDRAKTQLTQQDPTAVRADLKKQFKSDELVIEESFSVEAGQPAVSPAVGEQAQKAKLNLETTYQYVGLARAEIKTLLDGALKDTVDSKPNQSIFSNGSNTIHFQSFQKLAGNTYSARLVTTGYVGTTINTKDFAKKVSGKRFGEIQQMANQLPGVNNVDIKFSPFWVNSAPSDPNKINVRFTVVNDTK